MSFDSIKTLAVPGALLVLVGAASDAFGDRSEPAPCGEFSTVQVEAVEVPAIDVPAVHVPEVYVPEVHVPAITVPGAHIPAIHIPEIRIPAITVAAVHVPATEGPAMSFKVPRAHGDEFCALEKEEVESRGKEFQSRSQGKTPEPDRNLYGVKLISL